MRNVPPGIQIMFAGAGVCGRSADDTLVSLTGSSHHAWPTHRED